MTEPGGALTLSATDRFNLGDERLGGERALVVGFLRDPLVVERLPEILGVLRGRARRREREKDASVEPSFPPYPEHQKQPLTDSRHTRFHSLNALFHSSSFCFNLANTIGTATQGFSCNA